jgi:hypothetical protein
MDEREREREYSSRMDWKSENAVIIEGWEAHLPSNVSTACVGGLPEVKITHYWQARFSQEIVGTNAIHYLIMITEGVGS